jgi:hypothetical protein
MVDLPEAAGPSIAIVSNILILQVLEISVQERVSPMDFFNFIHFIKQLFIE